MNLDSRFEQVHEELSEELDPTAVEVRKADSTLVFWKNGERVGLEVPKEDVKQLYEYFAQFDQQEHNIWERVRNKVKQDTYHYLVLKYL